MDFLYSSGTANRCETLQQVNYTNLAVSLFLLIGIIFSYLIQHYKILHHKSSHGFSAGFILLGETSSACAFANILLLPSSRADVTCCKTISAFECAAGLLGIAQVGAQWSCFTILSLLFLLYTPRGPTLPHVDDPRNGAPWWKTVWNREWIKDPWKLAVGVTIACFIHAVVITIVSTVIYFCWPSHLHTWANTLGISAAILSLVQYVPQLIKTYKAGEVGSLSIGMMLLQTPGSFLWAATLMARFGWEGWSLWGLFMITGSLQGALLVMCIYFNFNNGEKLSTEGEASNGSTARCVVGYMRNNQNSTETDDEGGAVVESAASERTPLIKRPRTPGQEH